MKPIDCVICGKPVVDRTCGRQKTHLGECSDKLAEQTRLNSPYRRKRMEATAKKEPRKCEVCRKTYTPKNTIQKCCGSSKCQGSLLSQAIDRQKQRRAKAAERRRQAKQQGVAA